MGAIGIARCFMYAGSKGHAMHNPNLAPRVGVELVEGYGWGRQPAMNHFHEKLLKLKVQPFSHVSLKSTQRFW